MLLRPLPAIGSLGEVVEVVGIQAQAPERFQRVSWANYVDYASHTAAVRALAATVDCDLSLIRTGPAERISGLAVSGNYFAVLRLTPAARRLLSPADERSPVAVLGYGL